MVSINFVRVALLAAPLTANAHYIFSQLIVNGEAVGSDYSYIRQNTNTYMPSYTDDVINSENLRCNEGATNAASDTYDVMAGDTVGFKLAYDEFIEHPGPGFVYMSLAPGGDVSSYDGSGDWFKVWESGLSGSASNENNWGTWQDDRIEFTIPTDTPDGEYLVRPEHIAIHEGHVGKAQFYMECAQLRVSGGGNGSPGPMVKIPGLYTADEVNFDMWSPPVPSTYAMPGPAVWSGGGSAGGSANSSSGISMSAPAAPAPSASQPAFSMPAAPSAPAASPPAFSYPAAPSVPPAYSPTTFATVTGSAPAFSIGPVASLAPTAASSYAPVSSGAPPVNPGNPDCEVSYVRL
ncbi:uncharacterized protein LTR77_001591 [Saxophila tyrrhenica]|uniref:AA9 family lytic polysaccharide monooxygenase n=1 Tax=Saxophila tyrrhenica TaxID=1690608 RepID=A0AAV9PL62_9PEZI|nr:hypothetical protein LTR77_001591 [Saxophila tyrrhenica]